MDEEQNTLDEVMDDNGSSNDETLDEAIEEIDDMEDYENEITEKKAAMVITVESWATPLVGILTLVLGLALGYFGRPLVSAQFGTPEPTAIVAAESAPAAVEPQPNPTEAPPTLPPEEIAARQTALMEAVLPRVRHFKGNPDAPITMIEFSDFQ